MEEKIDKIIRILTNLEEKIHIIEVKVLEIDQKLASGVIAKDEPANTVQPTDRLWEEEQAHKDVQSGGRLRCPDCGAVGKDIATEDDKDNVITYIGGVPQYGKKYYCKKCMKK